MIAETSGFGVLQASAVLSTADLWAGVLNATSLRVRSSAAYPYLPHKHGAMYRLEKFMTLHFGSCDMGKRCEGYPWDLPRVRCVCEIE